jgi:hypothetical protein
MLNILRFLMERDMNNDIKSRDRRSPYLPPHRHCFLFNAIFKKRSKLEIVCILAGTRRGGFAGAPKSFADHLIDDLVAACGICTNSEKGVARERGQDPTAFTPVEAPDLARSSIVMKCRDTRTVASSINWVKNANKSNVYACIHRELMSKSNFTFFSRAKRDMPGTIADRKQISFQRSSSQSFR